MEEIQINNNKIIHNSKSNPQKNNLHEGSVHICHSTNFWIDEAKMIKFRERFFIIYIFLIYF